MAAAAIVTPGTRRRARQSVVEPPTAETQLQAPAADRTSPLASLRGYTHTHAKTSSGRACTTEDPWSYPRHESTLPAWTHNTTAVHQSRRLETRGFPSDSISCVPFSSNCVGAWHRHCSKSNTCAERPEGAPLGYKALAAYANDHIGHMPGCGISVRESERWVCIVCSLFVVWCCLSALRPFVSQTL